MSLENQILQTVKSRNGIKAKEIASLVNTDKKVVNGVLYGALKGQVYQDKQYRWFAGNKSNNQGGEEDERELKTPLARLSKYYLECISRDIDAEVSVFASSKYGCPDYGQLPALPLVTEEPDLYDGECTRNIFRKVVQEKKDLNLVLGYPLCLFQFQSKKGHWFYKVEPLFLFKYDQDSIGLHSNPVLSGDVPQINTAAFRNLTGISGYEALTEMLALYDELGLEGDSDSVPDWDEVFNRLQSIRPEWPWKDALQPEQLNTAQMDQMQEPGIYNMAGVFASERSKYTVGLERELNDLISKSESDYEPTALGNWINRQPKNYNSDQHELIEPIPLNEEQKQVVEKALKEPLTIVTGPPGTGKSQVVTNILVNAVYNQQTVLFASRNHKAVDVVNERVNNLSSRPVLLRVSGNEMRQGLAEYLSKLLSSTVTQSDKQEHQDLSARSDQLREKLSDIQKRKEGVIKHRNRLDKLEQEVEPYREYFGEDLFSKLRSVKKDELDRFAVQLKQVERTLQNCDKTRQNLLVQLSWKFLRDSRMRELETRFAKLESLYQYTGRNLPVFDYEDPDEESEIIQQIKSAVKQRKQDLEKITKVNEYYDALEQAKNQPDLFELAKKTKSLQEQIQDNSQELWDCWCRLLPERLSDQDREVLGKYVTLLKMIIQANEAGSQVEKKVWAQFYEMQEKAAYILPAWALTSLSVKGKVPFKPAFFDLVVIDEASQCDIASALPLLYRAKRAVIIGDPNQLRHITQLNEREDHQLLERYSLMDEKPYWSYAHNSLYDLAVYTVGSQNVVTLRDHHRSHKHIVDFSNRYFYDGLLRIATKYEYLNKPKGEPAVSWTHVSGKAQQHSQGGTINTAEAQQVIAELQRVISNGYKGSIGVVTPFRQQANLIRGMINKNQQLSESLQSRYFLADTVHKFQGDERDLMIFSPTYSEGIPENSIRFLNKSGNLFNVAITRARGSLKIVGNKNACQQAKVDYLKNFAQYVDTLKEEKEVKPKAEDLGAKFPSQYDSPKVSDWEKLFYEQLYKTGIRTMPQYQVEQYTLDLAIIDGDRKLDIEIDGEKYHKNWDGELLWRDQLRNMRLIELGWDVKRFWVYEVRDDLERCVSEVKDWVEAKN